MIRYVRTDQVTRFRIVWTELRVGAPAQNQRNMAMTRLEEYRFRRMQREGLRREMEHGVSYEIESPDPAVQQPGLFDDD